MYVIIDPDYATTNWCQSSVSALKNQARKKRVTLCFSESYDDVGDDRIAFVLGGTARWIAQTVTALQARACHPIILSELPNRNFFGKYSSVKTDYGRFMSAMRASFPAGEECRAAFYGMNHASFSDMSRLNAFYGVFRDGEIFENHGSLEQCFIAFLEAHKKAPFNAVICANDFAAVSLLVHLRSEGVDSKGLRIAVHSNARLLRYFPEIISAMVDYTAVATAAFEIAACIENNPAFIGMRITVDCLPDTEFEERGIFDSLYATAAKQEGDALYTDGELCELMRIERLMSECDETDIKILRLLSSSADEIAENTFLSDNGVKYRIKKMKRICCVDSKREIPLLLAKYGIVL